jgi:hypothetical protein
MSLEIPSIFQWPRLEGRRAGDVAAASLRLYRFARRYGLAAAFRAPFFLGTALSLFKERRKNASERNQQADDEEAEAHGAPE